MKQFSIKESFAAGWHTFTRRPWYLFGLMLSFALIFVVSLGNAFVTALAYVVYGGFLAMLINHFRGAHIRFDDIIPSNNYWMSFAVLTVIKTFFILLGFLLLIIPGVYLSIRWMFAEMLVVDKGMKPLEALKASSKLTAGTRGKLFWLMIVVTLFNLAGLLLLVVGVFATSVVTLLILISVYEKLLPKLTNETPAADITPEAEPVKLA